MIFFTKMNFYQKLLEYLIIHVMHLKALTKFYTLIPMSFFIDTYLRGNIAKLVDFSQISWIFAYFWKLNFQISHMLQIESKK